MSLPLMNHSALALLRNARAFPLLPAVLASVSVGFVLVRVRVRTLYLAQLAGRLASCTPYHS